MHESAPKPNAVARPWKSRLFNRKTLPISLIVVIVSGIVFSELEAYRRKKSEKLMFQFAEWVKAEILDKNPVSYRNTGGGSPDWFGDAFAFVDTETPSGQPISIQIYVKSSPFGTKVEYIDLYASGMTGEHFRKLSTRQLADVMGTPRGRKIHLGGWPADILPRGFAGLDARSIRHAP